MLSSISGQNVRSNHPAEGITKAIFPVLEMTCATCAVSVASTLKSVLDVRNAGVNFADQSAWVQ